MAHDSHKNQQRAAQERPPGVLMDASDVARALKRVAHEIVERNRGVNEVVLIGLWTRGVPLARRIAAHLAAIENQDVPVGALDVALYRDDYRTRRVAPQETSINFDVSGKVVVLVDDVLFTGRTVRAALDALNDLGRPASVQLAVLIDRGHRELPLRADFVGKNAPTARDENVTVHLTETDGEDVVRIEKN
ncbi:MAG TPA: bifunctional pyr operon transcriptional regulator/uracil phosphoribosyltransferase PyrR [Abditibacteriaceae bacterium]|nr:bifunctional pyr operon transcriptional regulator/uracil phosphoribosyltransferase PyrR [Abditibacteriaceae bacterium]